MAPAASDVRERASRIRVVLFDSDGVFTDGRLYSGAGGEDLRAFDVKDGHGIVLGREAGLGFGIVSGKKSDALARRAAELRIAEVHQGVSDKGRRVDEILGRLDLPHAAACFMGDDLIDLPAMRRVGLSAAPADAVAEVRQAADWVAAANGGRGALRELIELLLRASGNWEQVTRRYHGD